MKGKRHTAEEKIRIHRQPEITTPAATAQAAGFGPTFPLGDTVAPSRSDAVGHAFTSSQFRTDRYG
jgi:hypothetical protein